jgi:hypothetical protein
MYSWQHFPIKFAMTLTEAWHFISEEATEAFAPCEFGMIGSDEWS